MLLVTVYFHWVVQSQGWAGSEKSILWTAMTFLLFVRGAGEFSLDGRPKRVF